MFSFEIQKLVKLPSHRFCRREDSLIQKETRPSYLRVLVCSESFWFCGLKKKQRAAFLKTNFIYHFVSYRQKTFQMGEDVQYVEQYDKSISYANF